LNTTALGATALLVLLLVVSVSSPRLKVRHPLEANESKAHQFTSTTTSWWNNGYTRPSSYSSTRSHRFYIIGHPDPSYLQHQSEYLSQTHMPPREFLPFQLTLLASLGGAIVWASYPTWSLMECFPTGNPP